MDNMLLIDGNSLINRAFYALPPLTNDSGQPTQAVYGFTTMLLKALSDFSPKYVAVAFDLPEPTFRHKRYDGYKATRKGMPEELAVQLPILKEELRLMGISIVEKAGYEADDIIGTLASDDSVMTYIITGDRDSFQLINDTTRVVLTKRGITETVILDEATLIKEYGLAPKQVIDFKSLAGDSSDNIPGVTGIGEKTAVSLIQTYGSLEGVYEKIDEQKGRLRDKLENGREMAELSKELATIDTKVPLSEKTEDFTFDFPFSAQLRTFFAHNRFKSLLKRDDIFKDGEDGAVIHEVSFSERKITNEAELTEFLRGATELCVIIGEDIHLCRGGGENGRVVVMHSLIDMGFGFSGALGLLKGVLENESVRKTVYDAKSVKRLLSDYGIGLKSYDDVKLLQYLVDQRVLGASVEETLENAGLDGNFPAAAAYNLKCSLFDEIEKRGMTSLYKSVELPLIEVLYAMEERGVRVDVDLLESLGGRFISERDELARVIYSLAGKNFNINSPRQLAAVLFDDLKIPYPKKSAKHSTNAEILDMIVDKHEIVPLCQKWRFLAKLHSTYIEGLRNQLKDGCVHTEYKQMLTTTGRLSSAEPNLQNIPVREEEGKVLRGLFVAREGYTLVAADYSQIELRLLAHFSGDERMVELYRKGEDIHARTAAEVFGVPIESVTSQQRRAAKAVNFGIVYGMSDYGLSQSLHCTVAEAKRYMETYFSRFPSIKPYLEGVVDSAKKNGCTTTLLNRVRFIPELASPNLFTRQFGERAAMNMPLQGSAADVIKVAMLKVSEALEGMESKLILQIHDELIVEAADGEVEDVKRILTECMESAVELKVPLTVDVAFGKSWLEC